jgi:ribonucleoside-diphosphate reductase alpha chain
MNYSENATNLFKKLYFKRDKDDNIVEDHPNQVFDRVAKGVSEPLNKSKLWYSIFLSMMSEGYFRPCTPCMMNVGVHEDPQTAACFVGNLQDSLLSIFDFDKESGIIFSKGSGIGGNFGMLREEGALLSTGGRSSGPFAFLKKWAATADAVKSGGTSRRAAEMGMFIDTHPDLLKFITIKNGEDQQILKSMNLSIAATNDFMNAVINDKDWNLIGVKDGKIKSTHKAKDIYNRITQNAFDTGDPGLWFIDHANDTNGLIKQHGRMLSTNPCGEISGTAYFACALASINLVKFVRRDCSFDWEKFKEIVRQGITFLDAMISISGYPTENYKNKAQNVRPLGLGIMGLADMLCKMGLSYDSTPAYELCEKITRMLTNTAILTSIELGKVYGSFPDFEENKEKMVELCKRYDVNPELVTHLRNCNWTTIAPTGSTSISCDCSPGMEPLFGITYTKNVVDSDEKWIFVNPIFEELYSKELWYEEAIEKIELNHGSCQEVTCVPKKVQKIWKTAHDIHWKERIEMQSHLQTGISNSISSCLVGDSFISTNRGLMTLDEIVAFSEKKEGFNNIEHAGILVRNVNNVDTLVKEVFLNGEQECLTIKTTLGREITGTENHKLMLLTNTGDFEWRELQDIKEGDYIVGRKGLGKFGNSQMSISSVVGEFKFKKITNTKDFKLPCRISRDFARFLGYLTSDGGLNQNGFFLSQQRNNIVEDFRYLTKSLFELETSVVEDPRAKNLVTVVCNSRPVMRFLKHVGIRIGSHNKIVPEVILKCAGRQQTKEFIKGITLDGTMREDKIYVMSSTSLKLLRQLQELIAQFGIRAGIFKGSDESESVFPNSSKLYKTKKCWGLICVGEEARKFCNQIGFIEDRLKELSNKYYNKQTLYRVNTKIPECGLKRKFINEVIPNISSKVLRDKFYDSTSLGAHTKEIRIESLKMFKAMGLVFKKELVDPTYDFFKVTEIVNAGIRTTYDISVPNGNSYVGNGFVSHNTINLPKSATVEDIRDIYIEAWQKKLKGVTFYRDGSLNNQPIEFEQKKEITPLEERPKIRSGKTHEIFTGHGKIYVTVNKNNDGNVLEIFTNGGKNGGVSAANLEAIARLASLALQEGVSVDAIARTLLGISDGTVAWDKLSIKDKRATQVISIPDAIGQILYRFYTSNNSRTVLLDDKVEQLRCPDCGGPAFLQEGCIFCVSCGSKCG